MEGVVALEHHVCQRLLARHHLAGAVVQLFRVARFLWVFAAVNGPSLFIVDASQEEYCHASLEQDGS